MKTPVLIPAFNAAPTITRTLERLPRTLVEPIVAVNGPDDGTVQIAERFGCTVNYYTDAGKLPALQKSLHALGERAVDPVILLDADARPLLPQRWHNSLMAKLLEGDEQTPRPQVVGGPSYLTGSLGLGLLRSTFRYRSARQMPRDPNPEDINTLSGRTAQYGPSMGLHLKNQQTLRDILELPSYLWPGEDRALVAVVLDNGGRFTQALNVGAVVVHPLSESFPSLRDTMRMGMSATRERVSQNYLARGPEGSQPFDTLDALRTPQAATLDSLPKAS